MNAKQIKDAVDQGKKVNWKHSNYVVEKNKGDYDIVCTTNNHRIGLTWLDGVTLNGKEEDFYIND